MILTAGQQEILLRPVRKTHRRDCADQRRHHELPMQPERLGVEGGHDRKVEVGSLALVTINEGYQQTYF